MTGATTDTTKGYPTVTHKTPRIWPSVIAAMLLLIGSAAPARSQSYTIMPTPFQAPLNDTGSIVVGGCVWTYAAGTTTPISTYTNTSGTTNSNPIIVDSTGRFTAYLLAGTNYKFVYETACTPPAHGTVLRTADPIAGVPAAAATVDVTGTAGETISAGQCAYLSAGDGGKTTGSWYKCDTSNPYSSTLPEVGIAPSAIVSGSTGTIRIYGAVTGLSALTTGTDYFAGVAGALTSTAPVSRRYLGRADTTTSLILREPPIPTQAWINDFRLTLTTGTCKTTSDVSGASAVTIFASPCDGNRIDLPDASGNPIRVTSAEFSIAVPATTSTMYDVFAFLSGSTATLELLAWTNPTTRATAIVRTNGRWMKSGDSTRLYLGSFATGTVSGQTEDSITKRYLSNYYNRMRKPMLRQESAASWTYNLATIRQTNANVADQLDFVIGVSDWAIDAMAQVGAFNATAGTSFVTGIGLDSTTTFSGEPGGAQASAANQAVQITGKYKGYPGVGKHFIAWNEVVSVAGGNTTFVTTTSIASSTSGISAWGEW